MAAAAPDADLVDRLRGAFAAAGDPERAVAAQAYMKSALPYHGVPLPEVRRIVRRELAAGRPLEREAWQATILALYDDATHREDRYAAVGLARHRSAAGWQDPEVLALYHHLVVVGAWWDLVDEIASHLVGGVLAGHRERVTATMRAWSVADDPWVRRTSILCQLRHGPDTDTALLHDVIEASVEDRSFWLRKAIGWALRQYARTDQEWVRREVDAWGPRLSGLSRREALKWVRPRVTP